MKKKGLIVSIVTGMLVLGATGVYGASSLTEIKANLNHGILIILHGANWQPKDVNGTALTPITYKGSTYVPLRSVSEALNVAVDYDADTKQITIGEKRDSVSFESESITFNKAESSYAGGVTYNKDELIFNEKNYASSFFVKDINSSEKHVAIDLGKQYAKGHLVLGFRDEEGRDVHALYTIFNSDKEILATGKIKNEELLEVDFDIINVDKDIYVGFKSDSGGNLSTWAKGTGYVLWEGSWVK